MPESPRYLLIKGRKQQAWSVVHYLHSDPEDSTNEFAKREYYQILKQMEFENTMKSGWGEILRKASYRKRAFITVMLSVCLMSSGILVIQSTYLETHAWFHGRH